MERKVVPLFGGTAGQREVNKDVIQALETALEKARAGEIIGVVVVANYWDKMTGRESGGWIGNTAMIGEFEMGKAEMVMACIAANSDV